MIHTKWDGMDRYSYSSHITHTGTYRLDTGFGLCHSDFGYCCRIYPKLELEEPSMLAPANDTDWVLPQYSKAIFHLCFASTFAWCGGGEEFWAEYERRRGSKNGFENGLELLMDVETFENAQYSRWDIFATLFVFSLEDVIVYLSCFTSNRKAQGLIVALSGNLERPLVGQGYTFVEPGSANLISFSVGILGHNF